MRRRLVVILLIVVAVLVVGGIGIAGVFKATSTHQFCSSCHIMEPYIAAWQTSRHAKVECVQCHYPPEFREALWVKFQAATQLAKYVTQTYSSKPFAEVQDASCTRSGCHGRESIDARAPLTFKRVTKFQHALHLEAGMTGWQLRCTSCHAQVVVDKHFEVMQSTCFTCHFKDAKTASGLSPVAGCTGCHQAPQGNVLVGAGGSTFNHDEIVQRGVACQNCHLNIVQGRADAPAERCIGCHNERDKLARATDLRLVHEAHVTKHPIECIRCHNEIRHGKPSGATAASAPPR